MLKRTLVLTTVAIALLAMCVCLPNGSEAVSTVDEIQSAINGATDETETAITLENDITLTETLDIPAGKVIILDLAGNTLSIESGFAIEVSGELTINDSQGDGGISTGAGVAVITRNGSETTINGGAFVSEGTLNSYSRALEVQGNTTITAGSFTTTVASGAGTNFANAISVNGDEDGAYQPTLTIIPVDNSDVVVSSEHDYALSVRYGATLNIHGGTISGSDDYQDIYNLDFPDGGIISVNGGSFAFEVPSEYIADGYVCVPSDERFIVLPTTEAEAFTVSNYDELVSALDGNPTVTDSITMDSDITIPAGAEITLDFPDSLTIPDGVTLNILGTLEVNGYLYVDGTLTVSDRGFVENPLNVSIRDGTITGFPDGDEYTIMTPMDLQWLALANITSSMPSHIELGIDLDMSGYDYTSIGNYGTEVSGIEFDGNGHTISNITQDTGTADAGLFGDLYASNVHNLTLTGFNLKATSGYVGFLAGCIGDSCTFTSITIANSALYTSGSYGNAGFVGGVGGLQGHVVEFIDCHISDCTIDGYANTGGFWGTCSGAGTSFGVYNSSMENVDINIELTGASAEHPGSIGIVGGFCTSQSIEVIGLATTDVLLTIHKEPVAEPPFAHGTDNADTDNIDSTAVKDSNGDWVAMEDGEEIVATINGTPYTSINAAIENADAGDMITLVTSVTEDVVIPSGANITLDLGNHSITNVSGDTITIETGATVVITGNGTVDNITHQKAAVYNLGTFTLVSGTLTRSAEAGSSPSDSGGNSWYVVDNHGTMVVKGGTIKANGDFSSLIRNIGTSDNDRASLTIEDGFVSNRFNTVKNDDYGDLTITGGTIESDRQAVQNWADAEILGGTMNGEVHTYTYQDMAASLTVDGNAVINGNLCAIEYILSGESLDSITDPTVNIKGGTINGTLSTMSYDADTKTYETLEGGEAGEYAWFDVSGGTFTAAVEDRFVGDGTILIPNDDGSYGTTTTDKALIRDSGTTIDSIVTDGSSYVLTSSGPHTDVTVTIQFRDGTIVINGDFQKGAYTVVLDEEVDLADGMEAGFHIDTGDIEIDSITVTVEVPVDDGYRLTSALVYHQEDGSEIDAVGFAPDSFTEDGTVTFTTNTNSHYWIDATFEAVQTGPDFPPIWDDDDDYVPPVVPSQTDDSSDDDTTTIVACAAAAVVAALMAAFLIIERRRN